METFSPDIEEEPWEASLEREMRTFSPELQEELWKKRSIYHLPAFSKLMKSPTELTPQFVSFGPYHHGDPNLKLVEDYKQKTLLHFLRKADLRPRTVVKAMKEVVEELQAQYEYLEDKWKNKMEFVKIMIMDGCFMLELLRRDPSAMLSSSDPIFGDHAARHLAPYVKRDMLMLENQLPLQVLKVLLFAEAHETNQPKLMTDGEINNLVFRFLGMTDMVGTTLTSQASLGLHVLDLYRKGLIGTQSQSNSMAAAAAVSSNNSTSSAPNNDAQLPELIAIPIPSESDAQMLTAVKLRKSRVHFKPSESNKITSISFDEEKGILKLPRLIIDDSTESNIFNLMAFEHLHAGVQDVVTSYVCFLGALIHSARDVQLLCSVKIISLQANVNAEDAAEILNRLTKQVLQQVPTGEFLKARIGVNRYSRTCSTTNRFPSFIMDLYTDKRLTTIGVFVAVYGLVFTVIQTYYAVVSYEYPKKNV